MHSPLHLLVTGDAALADQVLDLLEGASEKLRVVEDPRDACIQIAGVSRFATILVHLDGEADEARGFAVLRTLRSERRTASVIMIADRYRVQDAIRLRAMGVADYLDRRMCWADLSRALNPEDPMPRLPATSDRGRIPILAPPEGALVSIFRSLLDGATAIDPSV